MQYEQVFKDLVADTYLNTDLSTVQVGDMYGVSHGSVRKWAIEKDPNKYNIAKGRNRQLLMALDVLESQPNIRLGELANLVGVNRSTVESWQQSGKIEVDIVCEICGEPTTTKYCASCVDKGWDRLVRLYNINYDQLKKLPTDCEVCGSTDRLHVDHNHTTGKYRGILCRGCNIALGLVEEKKETLENLIKYLETNNK